MTNNISFNELFDTKEKKLAFFQNLILVAVADRNVDVKESDFLLAVGNQLNLSQEDTRIMTDNLSSLSFIIPEDGRQKTIELQAMVMMLLQDGEIEEREYALCLEYARRIGYSKEILDDFVTQLGKKSAE